MTASDIRPSATVILCPNNALMPNRRDHEEVGGGCNPAQDPVPSAP